MCGLMCLLINLHLEMDIFFSVRFCFKELKVNCKLFKIINCLHETATVLFDSRINSYNKYFCK